MSSSSIGVGNTSGKNCSSSVTDILIVFKKIQHNSMPAELDSCLGLNISTYTCENVFRIINLINTKKHSMIAGTALERTVLHFFLTSKLLEFPFLLLLLFFYLTELSSASGTFSVLLYLWVFFLR